MSLPSRLLLTAEKQEKNTRRLGGGKPGGDFSSLSFPPFFSCANRTKQKFVLDETQRRNRKEGSGSLPSFRPSPEKKSSRQGWIRGGREKEKKKARNPPLSQLNKGKKERGKELRKEDEERGKGGKGEEGEVGHISSFFIEG